MDNSRRLNEIQANCARIMHYIKYDGIKTRTGLSEKTGLTKAGITGLTNEMIAKGMIFEKGIVFNRKNKGRNRIILEINDSHKLSIGITIEKDKIYCMLATLNGQALDNVSHSTDELTYHDILSLIVTEVKELLRNNCLTNESILGIGICISRDALHLIDGIDKFSKISKDLSHALNNKIISRPTIDGLLLAQKVFSQSPILNGCVLVIRYGQHIMSGFSVNCQIAPQGKEENGFAKMQIKEPSTTFDDYIKSMDTNEPIDIIDKLADDISLCDLILSPNKIFVLGDFFEDIKNIEKINQALLSKSKTNSTVEPFMVSDKSIAAAACAIIIDDYYGSNYFFEDIYSKPRRNLQPSDETKHITLYRNNKTQR